MSAGWTAHRGGALWTASPSRKPFNPRPKSDAEARHTAGIAFTADELGSGTLERMTGIEPALSAWEADVLPLNYIRLTRHFVCFCFAAAPRRASNVPQAWDRNLRVAHVSAPSLS
jgi:hypothetical protein